MPNFAPGSHYDPAQPRVPAGQPGAGEWTDAGGAENGEIQKASLLDGLLKLLLRPRGAPLLRYGPRVPIISPKPPIAPRGTPVPPPSAPETSPNGWGVPPVVPVVPPPMPSGTEEGFGASDRTAQKVLRDGYALLRVLSERYNSPERQAVVVFRALRRSKNGDADAGAVAGEAADADAAAAWRVSVAGYKVMSRAAVNSGCENGLAAVQQMVAEAISSTSRGDMTNQAYGSAVHARLDDLIKDPTVTFKGVDKSKFRAEISYGEDETAGANNPADGPAFREVDRGKKDFDSYRCRPGSG